MWSTSRLPIPCFQHSDAFVEIRKTNRERQAFAFVAFDGELAAVFADDSANDEEAQAGACGFRGEIGLEDVAEAFGGHAAAGEVLSGQ